MSTYLVFVYGMGKQTVQARSHRAAARRSGLVSPGAVLWVEGPDPARAWGYCHMRLCATHHRPPHLRLTLAYAT